PALPDVVRAAAGADVEVDTSVRRAASRLPLGVDGSVYLIARKEIGGAAVVLLVVVPGIGFLLVVRRLALEVVGDVIEHEAHALGVLEGAPVAAHALRDEDAAHAHGPHHARGVELDALHVDELGIRVEGEGDPVSRGLPAVGRELPALAHPARSTLALPLERGRLPLARQ